jgi:hypothetical protein
MKALTIWQPWATLVAIGAKRIETRGWETRYRGWLAIHAARKSTPDLRDLVTEWPFAEVLQPHIHEHGALPLGAIVAVARLVGCERSEDLVDRIALDEPTRDPDFPEFERVFGGYAPGRFGWILGDVFALPEPIEVGGAQGLWTVAEHHVEAIQQQWRGARQAVAP